MAILQYSVLILEYTVYWVACYYAIYCNILYGHSRYTCGYIVIYYIIAIILYCDTIPENTGTRVRTHVHSVLKYVHVYTCVLQYHTTTDIMG